MWREGQSVCERDWSYHCNCSQKGGTTSAASPDNKPRWDESITKSHHTSQLIFSSSQLTTDSIPSPNPGPSPDAGITSVWSCGASHTLISNRSFPLRSLCKVLNGWYTDLKLYCNTFLVFAEKSMNAFHRTVMAHLTVISILQSV